MGFLEEAAAMRNNRVAFTRNRISLFDRDAQKGDRLWDTQARGLVVRKNKSSSSFYAKVTVSGKSVEKVLGRVGEATIDQAREQCRELHVLAKADPVAFAISNKVRLNGEMTIQDHWCEYNKRSLKTNRRFSTIEHRNRQWAYAEATIGGLCLSELRRDHVQTILDDLVNNGKSKQAERLRKALSSFIEDCMRRGSVEKNVAKMVPKVVIPKDDALRCLDKQELGHLLKLIETKRSDPRTGDTCDLIMLLLLTACRVGEIRDLTWSDVQFDRDRLIIPADRSKTRQNYNIPMTKLMRKILQSRWHAVSPRKRTSKDLVKVRVFSSAKDSACQTLKRWSDGNKSTSHLFKGAFSPHDLRRTVATCLTQEFKIQEFMVERVLNHSRRSDTAVSRYDLNDYFDDKAKVMEEWGAWLIDLRDSDNQ